MKVYTFIGTEWVSWEEAYHIEVGKAFTSKEAAAKWFKEQGGIIGRWIGNTCTVYALNGQDYDLIEFDLEK